MARKYKMPREFKSEETRQRYIEGINKGSKMSHAKPRKITPELRERLIYGGKIHYLNKTPIVAEKKATYEV